MSSVTSVARPGGLPGAHGANAITIVIILKRKVIKKDFENVIDVGTRKISKILEKIVVQDRSNQVKEHYVVDINLNYVMKLIVLTVIIVPATWNVFGQTGVNGVLALQSVVMDIA